jgi:ATP-dependent DNA ligase
MSERGARWRDLLPRCRRPDAVNRLLFRREAPYFYAFDLLRLNGRDLRRLPLLERKARLARILPEAGCRVLFLNGIMERGCDLFSEICARDLEGIVGKWAHGCYQTEGSRTSWVKIKNPAYSQTIGRAELFEDRQQRRHSASKARPPELQLA